MYIFRRGSDIFMWPVPSSLMQSPFSALDACLLEHFQRPLAELIFGIHRFLSSTMSPPPSLSSLAPSILYSFLPRSFRSFPNRMSVPANEHVSRRKTLTRLYGEKNRCQYDYVHFGASPFPPALDAEPRLLLQQPWHLRRWRYLA